MAAVSDGAWNGDPARFTIEQWRRACLIDHGGNPNDKQNYSLPVRDPDGTLNRNALSVAAGRINRVQGITPAQREAAARKLLSLYGEASMTPPAHLEELAGHRSLGGDVEYRVTPMTVECRSAGNQLRIGGRAATFGSQSQLLGRFHEQISPTFFNESRSKGWPDVVARAEHDSRMLLGAVHSGTLELELNPRGLDYTVHLTPARQDVYESVARGDYGGSSFTFVATSDGWEDRGGVPLRTLHSGILVDVGPVTNPAYRDTSAALRSLARHFDAPVEDVEMYSRSGELRRFFTRSDRDPYQLYLRTLQRRWWFTDDRETRSYYLRTLEKRWPKQPAASRSSLPPLNPTERKSW